MKYVMKTRTITSTHGYNRSGVTYVKIKKIKKKETLHRDCAGRGRRGGAGGIKAPLGKMHTATAEERQVGVVAIPWEKLTKQ